MMSDKFVVSTNTVGEIIVTDTETGNVYHYGNMGNFLGLIRLLNEQQARIKELEKVNEMLKKRLSLYDEDEGDKYLRTHPMPTTTITTKRKVIPLNMRHKW